MGKATEDVGTTKRKPLTPKQRLALFEAHKGICIVCKLKINDPKWIDEHIRPLGQGGGNELANRAPAHIKCAEAKTNGKNGDNARTAKAKRQKVRAVIGKAAPKKKLEGPGFQPVEKASKSKSLLGPPRPMFEPIKRPPPRRKNNENS